MANAGYSADCLLIDELIRTRTMLKIHPDDNPIVVRIKNKINWLIQNDIIRYGTYCNGQKYVYHSAWMRKHNALIKINQIRQKYLYYKPVNL